MKKKEKEAYNQYSFFLETGDLYVFFPKMIGDWELDKEAFLLQWEKNNELLEGYNTEI